MICLIAYPFCLLFFTLLRVLGGGRRDDEASRLPPIPQSFGCPRWHLSALWSVPVQCIFAPGHMSKHDNGECTWQSGDIADVGPEEFDALYANKTQAPIRY